VFQTSFVVAEVWEVVVEGEVVGLAGAFGGQRFSMGLGMAICHTMQTEYALLPPLQQLLIV
jgi:hypothetical protein